MTPGPFVYSLHLNRVIRLVYIVCICTGSLAKLSFYHQNQVWCLVNRELCTKYSAKCLLVSSNLLFPIVVLTDTTDLLIEKRGSLRLCEVESWPGSCDQQRTRAKEASPAGWTPSPCWSRGWVRGATWIVDTMLEVEGALDCCCHLVTWEKPFRELSDSPAVAGKTKRVCTFRWESLHIDFAFIRLPSLSFTLLHTLDVLLFGSWPNTPTWFW